MTQEERKILLEDLCCRLPYYTIINCSNTKVNFKCYLAIPIIREIMYDKCYYSYKPYLIPISSMTDEQKKELDKLGWYFDNFEIHNIDEYHDDKEVITHVHCGELVDWLNKNHFDFRGLIKKGLALDASELNIY